MSNQKDKEKWQRKQENDKKRCINCSQLCKDNRGQYICYFLKSPKDIPYGGCIINNPNRLNVACYDKYHGKNGKTNNFLR